VVFLALFTAAYATRHLPHRYLGWIALAAVGAALFQTVYGLLAFTQGEQTILGLWPRPAPERLSGSFTNPNLAAHFLVMIWPLAVALWWMPDMPFISRLPSPLRLAATLVAGSLIGLALLSTASRLGAAAGLFAMFVLLVLHAQQRSGVVLWPLYTGVVGAALAALWFGLLPLTTRYIGEGLESQRWEVWGLMLHELPWRYWVFGVGLGGFEAVFKSVQGAHITAWYDYAHNDLLQWLLEMGVVGAALLVAAIVALIHRWRNSPLRAPVYAGMVALALIALGDFSWHVGGVQIAAAAYLGILLRPSAGRRRRRSHNNLLINLPMSHSY
jgi:O-antigen ligase